MNRRLRVFVACDALAALVTLTASPTAQDSVRDVVPGRDFQMQKLLSPGLTDVWKLAVEKDEMLWCVVESGAFDPVLQLVDADGQVLAENDGEGTRSELWLAAPATGPVEFRVLPYRGSGGGNYSFWLHRFRTRPLAADGEASGTFEREQWWNYRVALKAGDVLVPTVTGDGRLTGVFDAQRAAVPAMSGGYAVARDGDVFVRVEGAERQSFRLATQLARQRDMPAEPTVDDVVPANGFDIWRVPLRAGAAIALDVAMPDVQLGVECVDAKPDDRGPRFATPGQFDKGGRLRRYLFVNRDVTLELRLRNPIGSRAPYSITCSEPAAALSIGQRVRGELALGAGALHRLHADAGRLLRLRVHSAAFDARCDLWNPNGAVIANADDASPLDRDATHTFLVDRPGDYHLLVWTTGCCGSGPFELEVDELPIPVAHVGEALTVAVAENGVSYVHVDLRDGQTVWYSVRSRTFDAALSVLDPAGNGSFHCQGGGLGGDVLVAYRASHTGRHTLLVHGRGPAGDAEVRVVDPTAQ